MKTTTIAMTLAGGVLVAALPATVAQADDDRDVFRSGAYTVKRGQEIDGDLTVRGGTVTIYGSVDGNVRQIGKGSVVVKASGDVDGNIVESGKGSVNVRGEVDGNISERGRGHVKIFRSAEVDGNVAERNKGNLVIWRGADIDGNTSESGKGKRIRR